MPTLGIVLIYLLLTYSGGLWSLLGSFLIVFVAWLAWRRDWPEKLGLQATGTQWLLSLLAFSIACVAAWILITAACQAKGIHLTPIWQREDRFTLALHTLGQTFNEEIVLGWLLLTTLQRGLPWLRPPGLALIVGVIFTVAHFVFYLARPPDNFNQGILSVATLLTVFAVGTVRNNLILGTGTIALAWGVHLGWNLIFIDSTYFSMFDAGGKLNEPEVFNVVFGYTQVIVLMILLLGVSFMIYRLPKASQV